MRKDKFVNVEIEGESNIAVLNLGLTSMHNNSADIIKRKIEEKLVDALEHHFDCPVKIRLTEVLSTLGTIRARATVVIESEEEDKVETVTLNETWVY